MGKYPVICITLKGVHGKTFNQAYLKLAEIVAAKANEYGFLKDSLALDEKEKAKFEKLCDEEYLKRADDEAQSYATSSIINLATMLYKHFKKQVYVLIDEYDVPLAKAQEKDYHDEMVALISSLFDFFKTIPQDPETGEQYVSKVIMTGCLKVAKNSIFTGVNNLYVNTVVDRETEYTGIIGFTKEETNQFLNDYELGDFAPKVKDNYDGYKFYDKEIFCPWDIVSFISDYYKKNLKGTLKLNRLENYWEGTTSDKSLSGYIGYLTDNDNQKMQDLVDGKSISFILNESMNYDCLSQHESDDFWSLLLHTGYLTVDWEKTDEAELSKDSKTNKEIFARIPNLEILECFEHNIKERFGNVVKKDNLALNISNALLEGNVDFVQNKLGPLLRSFVSIRDTATRAPHENYYNGFLNGIFTNCKDNLGDYYSHIESGDGYPDLLFKDIDCRKVAIIEIKSATIGSDIETLSEKAISQIEDKKYAEPLMSNKTVKSIYGYGITFAGKSCAVSVKKLK